MDYKRSDQDLIFCRICNKQTKYTIETFAVGHLKKYHPECKTSKDYYDKFYKVPGEGVCPVCGKDTKYQTFTIGYAKHCSSKCTAKNPESKKKLKNTLELRYGDKNYVNKEALRNSWKNKSQKELQIIVEKNKQTKLQRYGNKNFNNCEQIEQTKLKKYGNKNYTNIEKIKKSLVNFYNNKRINYINKQIKKENLNIFLLDCKKDWYKFKCNTCNNDFEIRWQLYNLRKKSNSKICLHCNPLQKKFSNAEKEILEFIKQNYSGSVLENVKDILSGRKEFDIYLPDIKVAIEYNGLIWHSEKFNDNVNSQQEKTLEAESLGIHLIHIYEDDWNFKKDIIKSRILNILGKSFEKVYARKCELKEVSFNDSKIFLERNHLQGNVNAKFRYGLYYNNELVSLMTFGNLRKSLGYSNKENSFEMYRFCNKLNTNVVGAASKIFKYFLNNVNPDCVISYADRSWSFNNSKTLYDVLGFVFSGVTKSNYFYIKDDSEKRLNRFNFRKSLLVSQGADSLQTEEEIMLNLGYYRIYDSGSIRYIWRRVLPVTS